MKKFIAIILTAVLAVVACLGLTACGKNSDYDYVKNKGTLNIGITIYDPMDYFDEDGETIIGFDADVARKVCKELGLNATFCIIKWDSKVLELNSKAIDCIWNGMTVNDELKNNLTLSVPYAENMQVAVVKSENKDAINSVDTVKAASIAVESGSAGNAVANDTLKAATVNAVGSQLAALNEVAAGTSQVAIIDLTMAKSVVGKGDFADLVIVDTNAVAFEEEEFAIGFRKGSDLAEKVNELLKKYYADGSLQEIADNYSGSISIKEIK